MTQNSDNSVVTSTRDLESAIEQINKVLQTYSDKDWNYSRITLTVKPLDALDGPYALLVEFLDLETKGGRDDWKALVGEVKWGERHSSELGILELVSLRANKALMEASGDDFWNQRRPVIRIAKKEGLAGQNAACAIWYEIREVAGEDFDNR
jgi:hypothetical protein